MDLVLANEVANGRRGEEDFERPYKALYAASLDPFADFSRRERQRSYARLSPAEKITLKGNRVITDRVKGAYGFQPGRRNVTLVFTVERPLLATLNFFGDWNTGAARAASFTIGWWLGWQS